MSKIGKKPIAIPEGVDVNIDKNLIKVKWPKGELQFEKLDCVKVTKKDTEVVCSIDDDDNKKFWGLTRTLIFNMIEGVVNGYEKKLLIMWVGYGVQQQWNKLVLSLGFSHKVDFQVPDEVSVVVEQDPKWNSIITLKSIDKQKVWEVAAKIRSLRKPEPYKGKGVRYFDEVVKLKAGKTAGK